MKNFYEYITEVSKEKQERLIKSWASSSDHSYRWEDVVREALKGKGRSAL